jgi:hypothetical protein
MGHDQEAVSIHFNAVMRGAADETEDENMTLH